MADAIMKRSLREHEAKRADERILFHDAEHRFMCVARFMRRKARFIEKSSLLSQ